MNNKRKMKKKKTLKLSLHKALGSIPRPPPVALTITWD
jgi:hypothetical protein